MKGAVSYPIYRGLTPSFIAHFEEFCPVLGGLLPSPGVSQSKQCERDVDCEIGVKTINQMYLRSLYVTTDDFLPSAI